MKSHLLSFVFAILSLSAIGQGIVVDSLGVAVNENKVSADPSAILDVSSNSKGLLIPRVTNTEMQAIPNPAEGLIVYNTTNSSFYYYKGSVWSDLAEISDIPVDGDSDSSNEIQGISASLGSNSIDIQNENSSDVIRFTAGSNVTFSQGLRGEGILINSPDADNDATNEKITSASVVGDYLRIIEGGVTRNISLSSIQSYWNRNSGDGFVYPSTTDRLKLGGSQISQIYSTNAFFGNQTPKMDIQTGTSSGGYSEFISINHRTSGAIKAVRRLGLLISLADESLVSTAKSGGLYVESTGGWSNSPVLKLFAGNYAPLTVTSGNQVGINTSSPSKTFYVNGTAGGTYGWNSSSDERLKENILTIDSALNIVENLRGVYFSWKQDSVWKRPDGRQVGFIAQEVKGVLPEVVSDITGEDPYYSVTYAFITPVLAEAIKELKAQKDSEIEALNTELDGKETEIETLQTELQQLRATVEALQTAVEELQENN